MENTTSKLGKLVHSSLKKEKARRIKKKSTWPITSEIPKASLLTKLFDVVYYTSLKTEEGRPVTARLCLVNPENIEDHPVPQPREDRWQVVPLTDRLPLTVSALVKIAKAADPWTSALAVFYDSEGALYIWGLIDQTIHWNRRLVREGQASGYNPPGLVNVSANGIADISVYHEHNFLGRLQQDTILASQNDVFWRGPVAKRLRQWNQKFSQRIRTRVTPKAYRKHIFRPDYLPEDLWIATLCRILISIQRYRHGGAILVTDSTEELFPHYIVNYDRLPRHLEEVVIEKMNLSTAADLISDLLDDDGVDSVPIGTYLDESVADSKAKFLEDSLTGTVHFISSLSCVDGLILMKSNLAVVGYGVEIRTGKEVEKVRVCLAPNLGRKTSRVVDSNHFGTRHRSMMRYCFAHPSSLGFVVSQDGDIRAVMRVGNEIVMWDNLKVASFWFERYLS